MTFDSFTNRYCGLAVVRTGAVKSIDTPMIIGEYDPCTGMQKLAQIDLNHDGWPDFIFQVTARSNGLRSPPGESLVAGAVCLSIRREWPIATPPEASDAVTIRGVYTAAASVRAVEDHAQEGRREGVQVQPTLKIQ